MIDKLLPWHIVRFSVRSNDDTDIAMCVLPSSTISSNCVPTLVTSGSKKMETVMTVMPTQGFKTAVHESLGDVSVVPFTIYHTIYDYNDDNKKTEKNPF